MTVWANQGTGTAGGGGAYILGLEGAQLTPASNAITITETFHDVLGTGSFNTINGGRQYQFVHLRSDGGYTVAAGGNILGFAGVVPTASTLSLYFDGTSYHALDAGRLSLAGGTMTGPLIHPAGGGSETYTPGGVIEVSVTPASTTAVTTEETLWTYSMPANTLNANGRAVRITVSGTFAANANTKTVKLYFGASSSNLNVATAAPNALSLFAQQNVIRTGASAQVRTGLSALTLLFQNALATTAAEDTTAAIVIKVTGQNGVASAGDITLTGAMVEIL